MQIVSISSRIPHEPYYMFPAFIASCQRWGFTPLILKEGYGGLATKLVMLKRAIESGQIKDEFIIYCDSWDLVFQQTVLLYENLNKGKIIWNAEKNCFPDPKLADQFPETKTPYRYLNSGFSCGKTQDYLSMINQIPADSLSPDRINADGSRFEPNDQLLVQHQYLFGNTPMALDTKAELCQTLSGVEESELDFSKELISNRETGTTPIALHMNGSKERWKEKILTKLNLPM